VPLAPPCPTHCCSIERPALPRPLAPSSIGSQSWNRTDRTNELAGWASVTAPRGTVAGWEWVKEVNRITQWMTRLPSGDRCGDYPLGFGGGERICNPLGFVSIVVRVGDGGIAAEMFRSTMVPPSGGSEVLIWLIHPNHRLSRRGNPLCSTTEPA
jgi:hypothetical protein